MAGEWHPFPHRYLKCLLPKGGSLQRSSEAPAKLNSPAWSSGCSSEPNPREGDFSNTSGRPWPQRSTLFHYVDCKSAVGHRELPPRAANCRGAAGKGERGVLCFCWGGCAPTDGAGRVSYTSVPQFIQLFHLGHSHLALIFSDKDLEKLSAPSLLVPNQHLCVADMIGVKCCN